MSGLLRAITDMMSSRRGSAGKGKKPEPFSRSEFKKLLQQELVPAKRPPASRYRSVLAVEADAEPMTQPERGSAP